VCVVDFNPNVYRALQMRNLKVYYGDVSHADTLAHTGVSDAEIIICSVPDSLLKGTTNERLVRQLRALNPTAKIIATADVLGQTTRLYAAGADYVTIARLAEADELINAVTAAEAGLLDDMRASLEARLQARNEILP
jgi:voltage-gated potassium channel Kch